LLLTDLSIVKLGNQKTLVCSAKPGLKILPSETSQCFALIFK